MLSRSSKTAEGVFEMTNDLGVFTVSGEWMQACGYGHAPTTFTVLRVREFPGRGEGFERFFALDMGEGREWIVAEGRGIYLPAVNDLTVPGGCGAARNPIAVIWTARSSNKKTGPMPVSTTESKTCPTSCPFKGNGCYAESGPLAFLWRGLDKAGPNASWQSGVATVRSTDWNGLCANVAALKPGTLWRHNQAGDLPHNSGTINHARLTKLVKANAGRKGFTYTHHNALQNKANRDMVANAVDQGFTVNLSGNTLAHADALLDLAIAPVVVVLPKDVHGNVDITTPKGRKVVVCPATYKDDVSCVTCGLCAVAKRKVVVGFPAHGASAKKAGAVAVMAKG
jgi:hypothetical protein